MILTLDIAGSVYRFNIADPIDLSIPLVFGGAQPNAFYLPRATAVVAEGGDFIGDTRRGGSCNCETVTLNPHGNGTHTECIGHLTNERLAVRDLLRESLIPATLITVALAGAKGEQTITQAALEEAIAPYMGLPEEFRGALVVRTLPNVPEKQNADYSGAHAPYPSAGAMRAIRALGVRHLLLDLPSADSEDDPQLTNHHIFWEMENGAEPSAAARTRSITEMVYIPDSVAEGPYLLNLQIPPFHLDAAPSRPLFYRIAE